MTVENSLHFPRSAFHLRSGEVFEIFFCSIFERCAVAVTFARKT
jgi:hypothetical protein